MADMLFKTKGNASPSGKPRMFFACHPEDFDLYFDKICEDIFKTHDCAVYYEDTDAPIDISDLESVNLFVVPVTFKLLSSANSAMDEYIPYAFEKHIPVLPMMMESGLDSIYSRADKFGELQYLSPFSNDTTEVSFEEKLKKYLESVLVSDEMAKRVRAAFDAYIFLSYRKKDRKYANQLMRIIHSKPECRDIAIWYDEFLTPGESFRENIDKILSDSKLFALLVTPNLLEDHNFVMDNEYPAAVKSGIDILPAEMEDTDKAILAEKFTNLPEIANPYDDETFRNRLVNTLANLAIKSNDTDPEHNFLIGLAYLDGIDVEVDRESALELITKAAEAELPEAMEKLHNMYENGTGVDCDRSVSINWLEKLTEQFINTVAPESCTTEQFDHYSVLFSRLALYLGFIGRKKDSLSVSERFFDFSKKYYSAHADSVSPLMPAYEYRHIASVYANNDMTDKARENFDTAVSIALNSVWVFSNENIIGFISICRSAFMFDKYIFAKYGVQTKELMTSIHSFEDMSAECALKVARFMEIREDFTLSGKYLYRCYAILSEQFSESKLSDPKFIEDLLQAISAIRFFEQKHGTDEAYKEYTNRAIEIHKKLLGKYSNYASETDKMSMIHKSEKALGGLYSDLGEVKTSYSHLEKAYYTALELAKKYPSPDNYYMVSSCLSRLIDLLETFRRAENVEALKTLKRMKIECAKKIIGLYENAASLPAKIRLDEISTGYRTISSQYLTLEDYDNAVYYAHKVVNIAHQIYDMTMDLFTVHNAYKHLSEMYEFKGDYSAAFKYLNTGFEFEKVDLMEINTFDDRKMLSYRTQKLAELAYKANDTEKGQKFYLISDRLKTAMYNEKKDKRTASSLYYLLYDFRKVVKDEKIIDYLNDKMDKIKKYWPDI